MTVSRLFIVSAAIAIGDARYLRSRGSALDLGTPPLPSRQLTPQDWESAAGKFVQIPARRGDAVNETLWAKPKVPDATVQKCGTPCVAHCIAGQPRDMLTVKGLWKSIKHRLFEKFSDSPVVFAVLAVGEAKLKEGADEGTEGYVRGPQVAIDDSQLLPSLEYLGVDRALLLREACTTGECLQKGLRINCKASDLGISKLFDEKTGMYTNLCEIQASRFRDAMELVRDYEAEHQMKFDWVTRPRPDVYFTRPVISAVSLDSKVVHVSPWAACGFGGMDWFFALPRQYADTMAQFSSGVECSQYTSNPTIKSSCDSCPGCECWFAAWMYSNKVSFQRLPWQWFTPAKFCGTDCPGDWEVTPANVLGLDSQAQERPCRYLEHNGTIWCPA